MKRYRLNHEGIVFKTDLVRDKLQSHTKCNHAITPEIKVMVILRYLATRKMELRYAMVMILGCHSLQLAEL